MIDNSWSFWVQVAIFLGLVVNTGYGILKRKWEVQDLDRRAEALEAEVDAKAEEVKTELALRNAHLEADLATVKLEARHRDELANQRAEIAMAHRELLVVKMSENTALVKEATEQAKIAYTEANSVNNKIAGIGQQAVADHQQNHQTTEHIKVTTDNLHNMAQQYAIQQAPGGERALPINLTPPAKPDNPDKPANPATS